MDKLKIMGVVVGCAALIGISNIGSRDGLENEYILTKPTTIESMISTSVNALQKESNMTVMTARLNSVGTAKLYKLGMTAEQTDIVSFDVRYSIDLSKLNEKSFDLKDGVMTITLPEIKSEIIKKVEDPLAPNGRKYNNGSLLFSLDATSEKLTEVNNQSIKKDLIKQSEALIPVASKTAVSVTEPIFRMILDNAGGNHIRIKIIPFTN